MRQSIWIAVADGSEGLDVVESLARRDIPATFVAGREEYRVCIAASRDDLPAALRETALAVERVRSDAPLEAA